MVKCTGDCSPREKIASYFLFNYRAALQNFFCSLSSGFSQVLNAPVSRFPRAPGAIRRGCLPPVAVGRSRGADLCGGEAPGSPSGPHAPDLRGPRPSLVFLEPLNLVFFSLKTAFPKGTHLGRQLVAAGPCTLARANPGAWDPPTGRRPSSCRGLLGVGCRPVSCPLTHCHCQKSW